MSSVFSITGRFYGQTKSNIRRGEPVRGATPMVAFTVGEYNSWRKEMYYYRCIAFDKTAYRIMRYFTPKRCVTVSGRLGNNTFKKQGEEKEFRSVQFIVSTVDFPSDGDGVTPIAQARKNDLDSARDSIEGDREIDRFMEENPEPSAVPDDPDDLPF